MALVLTSRTGTHYCATGEFQASATSLGERPLASLFRHSIYTYGMFRHHAFADKRLWVQEWSNRATRCVCIRGALGDTWRACGTSTPPPSAVRSACRACVAASRPASTAAPGESHRSAPPREQSASGGRTREDPRHRRSTVPRDARPTRLACFRLRVLASLHSILLGSSCYNSTREES